MVAACRPDNEGAINSKGTKRVVPVRSNATRCRFGPSERHMLSANPACTIIENAPYNYVYDHRDFSVSHQAFCGYELSGSQLSHFAPLCARLSACSMSFPGPHTFILEGDEYVLQHDVVAL